VIVRKYGVKTWNEFVWFRIETSGGLLLRRKLKFEFLNFIRVEEFIDYLNGFSLPKKDCAPWSW
jgi:hypothetical protein